MTTEKFRISIESIYGVKTPDLSFDLLSEQFYQDNELIPINEKDNTINVNTPNGTRNFTSKLFPYWETEVFRTEGGKYAIRELTDDEIHEFLLI
jgi:type II secretory pathway pseudopilin PulG